VDLGPDDLGVSFGVGSVVGKAFGSSGQVSSRYVCSVAKVVVAGILGMFSNQAEA
jgi:hypothetical protein